jgi:hypothetical protein
MLITYEEYIAIQKKKRNCRVGHLHTWQHNTNNKIKQNNNLAMAAMIDTLVCAGPNTIQHK